MKRKGFTVTTLAEASKLSTSSISYYMKGQRRPTGDYMRVIAICIAMKLSYEDSIELLLYAKCETDISKLTEEQKVHYSCLAATYLLSVDGWNAYFMSRNFRPLITNSDSKSDYYEY